MIENSYNSEKVSDFKKRILLVMKKTDLGLNFGKLGEHSLHIRFYADESYAMNVDL